MTMVTMMMTMKQGLEGVSRIRELTGEQSELGKLMKHSRINDPLTL